MSTDPLVQFLMFQPTAIANLLAEHTDDGRGHCRSCIIVGQRGNISWPCTLYSSAKYADLERTSRGLQGH